MEIEEGEENCGMRMVVIRDVFMNMLCCEVNHYGGNEMELMGNWR